MKTEFITISHVGEIATITLNRPDKRNALHGPLVSELLSALKRLASLPSRVLMINGKGNHFCAGADIGWMQKMATLSEDENARDAKYLADLLYELYVFPKPVIVLAHGVSLGGGLGLVAAADMVIAADNASFGLPEVKMGLVPYVISPYVISAMGERMARYYFLTGEIFSAEEAYRIGFIHRLASAEVLMDIGMSLAQGLLKNGPHAMQSAKKLIHAVGRQKITMELVEKTSDHLATLRATSEAQEGLRAFLEKRKPDWTLF